MTLPGAPLPPRSCLDRGTRRATTTREMEALRRRVWQQQGVVSLRRSRGQAAFAVTSIRDAATAS